MSHIVDNENPITNENLVRQVENLIPGEICLYQFDTAEDAAEFDRHHDNKQSHQEFFHKKGLWEKARREEAARRQLGTQLENESPEDARQNARRVNELTKLFDQTFARVEAGSISAEYIDFEQFRRLSQEYAQAVEAKESPDSALRRVGFQPSSVYVEKLYYTTDKEGTRVPRKKPIRPLFQFEVGIRPNGTIIMLKDKFPGDLGTIVMPGADLTPSENDE